MENWSLPFALNSNVLVTVQRFLQEVQRNLFNDADDFDNENDEDREGGEDDFIEEDLALEGGEAGEEIPDNGEGDIPPVVQEIVITPDSTRTRRCRNRFTTTKRQVSPDSKSDFDRNRMRSRSPVILRPREQSI